MCSYTCNPGYIPTNISEANNVTCTTLSAWDRPLSSLCEKLKCPTTIPHGNISTICSREYTTHCYNYYCDNGYIHSLYNQVIKCNATGQWEWWWQVSTKDFCVKGVDLCASDIKNGRLQKGCGRSEGDWCSYSCDKGCKKYSHNFIGCYNKTWDVNTDNLCTDCVQCNHTIPHGSVSMTNCYAGQNCSYYCNSELEYVRNENITHVVCSNVTNGWVPSIPFSAFTSENDLCIARRCSTYIPNGHFLSSCSAEVGSVCRYKCDADYIGNVSEIHCLATSRYTDIYLLNRIIITYWSVDERQLCTNTKQCPLDLIPNGSLDQSCPRNPGDVCPYTCDYGYRPTHRPSNETSVSCTSSSTWNASFSLLCEKIVCSSKIPNGTVSCYNRRNYNDHCYYSCNYGYQKSKDYSSLTCNYDGQWEWTNPLPLKFCLGEEELCPSNIDGGRISSSCHRNEGSFCTYHCNGCRNYTAPSYLTCHNKTWDSDTRYLCTECTTTTTATPVRCPSRLADGYVYSRCSRLPNMWCAYYCNYGCTKQHYSIQCNSYGEWISGSSACTCTTCPFYIPYGYISGSSYKIGSCDFKSGSTCDVKCNEGCDVQYSTAYCETTGHWSNAESLCNCKEPKALNADTSDGGSTSTVVIVMSVVGAIAFLIIVACVITACNRRHSQPSTQSTSVSQSGLQQPPYQITTAPTNTQGTGDSAPTYFTHTSYIQGPPEYSELSFAKEVQTTPPPSYEDVSSHPLEVAQQPINHTPVIENISTSL